MTDTVDQTLTHSAKASKKSKGVSKKKSVSTHPPISEMVGTAITKLNERGGSSAQAIKKYIAGNYKVDVERLAPFIKKYLKSGVTSGTLVQTKGKGASGSFKLKSKEKKAVKPKVAKTSKPKSDKVKATKKVKKSKPKAEKSEKPKKTPKVKKASPKKASKSKPAGEKKSKVEKKHKAPKSTKPKSPKKKATKPKKTSTKKASTKK